MKFWILFTIISNSVWIGSGQNSEQETDKLVQKICKIATDKLHVHNYTHEEKIHILNKLKQKFLKAAKSHGIETSAYIRLIVQGVSILIHEDNYQKLCKNSASDVERRSIYRNLTTESANITLTDISQSNETALTSVIDANITLNKSDSSSIEVEKDMNQPFSTIDTLIEKTIVKSPSSKAEEINVQKVKQRFLGDFQKSRVEEVNFTKQLETGVDEAIDKHMSMRRMIDEGDINTNTTNPMAQIAENPLTMEEQLNVSDMVTEPNKARLYSKIDILINKTIHKSPLEKIDENAQKVKQKVLKDFKKVRGDEVNFTKELEIGIDKAIEKHIDLIRILDAEDTKTTNPIAQTTDEPLTKENQYNESKKATDQDKARLFSKVDILIEKTFNKSTIEKQEENAQKVKRKFLEDFKESRGDEVDFTNQLEIGIDKAIEKHMSLRRMFNMKPVPGLTEKSPAMNKQLITSEKARDEDKARLFSKIETLVQKTIDKSSFEKQENNLQNVKRRFLEDFRKSHSDEDNFIQLLENRFDYTINKHLKMRRKSNGRDVTLPQSSGAKTTKELLVTERIISDKSKQAINQDKARLFSKINSLIQKTIESSPIEKWEKNIEKVKRRFLTEFRKSHSNEGNFIRLLQKHFDDAKNGHLNMSKRRNEGQGTLSESSGTEDVKELSVIESKKARDKAALFSKIDTLLNATSEKIRRTFLKHFRIHHIDGDNFVQSLENRVNKAIDKHLVMRKMSGGNRNSYVRDGSLGRQLYKKSRLPTDQEKAKLLYKLQSVMHRSNDNQNQEEYAQKETRRFLDINAIKLMEKTFDDTMEKYIGNKNSNINTGDTLVNIAEEALMESGNINKNISKPEISDRPITTPHPFSGVTKEYNSCGDVLENACIHLKNLDKFTCENDSRLSISSMQVCDGNTDCSDGSDERKCTEQVITKIHAATSIMSQLELHRHCLRSLVEKSLLARQGVLLSNLLNSQVKFLQKYSEQSHNHISTTTTRSTDIFHSEKIGNYHYEDQVNTIVNEVAVIVRSFRTTLVGALCTGDMEKIFKRMDETTDIIEGDLDEDLPRTTQKWTPFLCACDGAFCANVTNCNLRCQKLCYKQQALTEFSCRSVQKGQNSISLDLVCDGKFDCYDEADEEHCPDIAGISLTATAKFEGSQIFNKIMTYLNEMALTREFEPGRVAMTNLGGCIQRLHQLSIAGILDLQAFRSRRNQCFHILKDIYASIVSEVENEETQAKAYNFLVTLSKNMIEGLRQTHFGNEKLVPATNCFCRGAECARTQCSKECARECFVKHVLTQYPCPSSNITISIDDLCNKNINCPKAEDETNCKQEICRNYQVKMLRLSINKIQEGYKAAIMGKILESWVNKVSADLEKLETADVRVSPEILKSTINKILNDLASTYLKFEARLGHKSQRHLNKFSLLATTIMEGAIACIY